MLNKIAPEWALKELGITQREWKARKRKEMKKILKSMDDFHYGCAYTPISSDFCRSIQHIKDLAEHFSVKTWGR